MGYNAFVSCNCYKQGLTTEPPYKDLIIVDEEDKAVYLDFPKGLWEKDKELFLQMDATFDTWRESACVHPNLEAASERLANMSGMAAFRAIVHEHGGAAIFPVLTEYLPQANGGQLSAALAFALLNELEALAVQPNEVLAVLREELSGELIYSVNACTQAFFIFAGSNKHRYGLAKDGFFIVEEPSFQEERFKERFLSTYFQQKQVADNQYIFSDLATGVTYKCSVGLRVNGIASKAITTFKVAMETVPIAQEYEYILAPLHRLAKVAIQTGNPICWT